jgi:hypothetical protein
VAATGSPSFSFHWLLVLLASSVVDLRDGRMVGEESDEEATGALRHVPSGVRCVAR